MNSRRSFLRSLGVAVMAVSMDVLPRFAAEAYDPFPRLIAALDGLIAVMSTSVPTFENLRRSALALPQFDYTKEELALVYGEPA